MIDKILPDFTDVDNDTLIKIINELIDEFNDDIGVVRDILDNNEISYEVVTEDI